ncbi:MAG: cupin domain-containing protein [Bacteroidota bacterium]
MSDASLSAADWISRLSLQPHPEGGYFGVVYTAPELYQPGHLPTRYQHPHPAHSSIYFLVTEAGFSAFHKLQTDEVWHFYAGSGLRIHLLNHGEKHRTLLLGDAFEQGYQFQQIVPRGNWFAAETEGAYSLIGCTLGPGFIFEDFELGKKHSLVQQFPQHADLITRLTRS